MEQEDEYILSKKVEYNDTEAEHAQIVVRKQRLGRRLDRYLHGRFPQLSRTLIQRLIKQGDVTVNTRPTKPSYEPTKGDVIDVIIPPPEPTEIAGEDIPLNVVYEDDNVIAINKQIGVICHPARPSQGGTIANAVVFHAEKYSQGTDPFRPGIIHRLDKNTTGVMLIAKDDETHWRIAMQFERRTIEKVYLGLCEGEVQLDEDIIDKPLAAHPIIKDRHMVPGMKKYPMATKQAITRYRVRERFQGFTLVEMFPKTGRTHQLRVHMSYIGHPIAGDRTYGGHYLRASDLVEGGSEEPLFEFQALHAHRIKFVQPIKEETLEIEAPLPPNYHTALELLRTHRPLRR